MKVNKPAMNTGKIISQNVTIETMLYCEYLFKFLLLPLNTQEKCCL